MMKQVAVQVIQLGDPDAARLLDVIKVRIEQRCEAVVVAAQGAPDVMLSIDANLPSEGFRIDQIDATIRIAGGSSLALLYGIGKFLRTSRYEEGFTPSVWRGTSSPHGSLRGMYFASHFHNWYHVAGDDEIKRYVEDIALWGVNAIMAIYPFINLSGWDDPEALPALNQLRRMFGAAKSAGLATMTGLNNVLFNNAPAELRATPLPDLLGRHGNSGTMICPSTPAGRELILKTTSELLMLLKDTGVDYLCLWPYDEGGCGCERCRPWGARGFIRMSHDIADMARSILPDVKIVLSTWTYDTPPDGEWQGLSDELKRGNGWVDYILADAHEDFPRYPLDVGVPGNLPLINFPEISMWGNWPWGGVGAHPMPHRQQRLWNQARQVLRGGFPYSEGIYEDMGKAIVSQFYWDPARTAHETVREYAAYEYAPTVVDEVVAMIDILESTASLHYMKQAVDVTAVRRAAELAEAIHARLPASSQRNWRWEILYLRALLDRERFAGGGLRTPVADAALLRLCDIYHCQLETDDPYHHRVRPPWQGAVSRHGEY